MARPVKTHNNTTVMNYLQGKHYDRLKRDVKATILSSTSSTKFHNTKGGKVRYVFDVLKKVSNLTNEEVRKCIDTYITENYFSNVQKNFRNDEVQYIRSNMYDPYGNVNLLWLKQFSSEFEELTLLEKRSYEYYGNAAREASVEIEKLITVPVLDPVLQEMIEDAIKKDKKNKKLIQDLLKNMPK
ncbi:TPA: hypothetical protein U2I12_000713 [Citrobacter farmeri]|uniref:hypothetical protein n=1 Tax=Citrobacter farmeri TaxID=67824 RepID=UPI000F67D2FC|nr:hypothetical protein [Citrobacter farmeri]RSB18603.1 hypothetical protein EGK65_02555 [Citrobacter farmeri]HEM6628071.1 hypothetical protein [Citrobacter farmeri]